MPEVAPNVSSLIRHGTERLRHAVSEPRREAIRIWSDLTGRSHADATIRRDQQVERDTVALFERAVARRSRGEPLAHVTGRIGFRTITIASDGRALIPRPETEGLIDLLLERVRTGRIADIGTGSGCLALSLAQEGDFTEIIGVDSSAKALSLARVNRASLGSRVSLVQGDLCRAFGHGVLDALISNPPYLTVAEYVSLDPSVRDWEPEAALVSGADGLDATSRLLDEGRDVLRPGGWLAFEVDCSRAAIAAAQACALGWDDVTVLMDLFGRERYLLARRSTTR